MIGHMEIRITLDQIEPPAGRLHVVADHGQAGRKGAEVCFTGWLGLLRALYEVTGGSGTGPLPGP
jgi:hypothetical protein